MNRRSRREKGKSGLISYTKSHCVAKHEILSVLKRFYEDDDLYNSSY